MESCITDFLYNILVVDLWTPICQQYRFPIESLLQGKCQLISRRIPPTADPTVVLSFLQIVRYDCDCGFDSCQKYRITERTKTLSRQCYFLGDPRGRCAGGLVSWDPRWSPRSSQGAVRPNRQNARQYPPPYASSDSRNMSLNFVYLVKTIKYGAPSMRR